MGAVKVSFIFEVCFWFDFGDILLHLLSQAGCKHLWGQSKSELILPTHAPHRKRKWQPADGSVSLSVCSMFVCVHNSIYLQTL